MKVILVTDQDGFLTRNCQPASFCYEVLDQLHTRFCGFVDSTVDYYYRVQKYKQARAILFG